MKNRYLIRLEDKLYRVFDVNENRYLVIDCDKKTMPEWITIEGDIEIVDDKEIGEIANFPDWLELTPEEIKGVREKYTMIAPILPIIRKSGERSKRIQETAEEYEISKQTVRKYLCRYLVYQDERCFLPERKEERKLTPDEKNYRWALNKFFYTQHKNSLKVAYKRMLELKYADENGSLLENHPTFDQFRYFYRKTKNMQNFYISREGIKNYQKNHRPLVGGSIQEYIGNIGTYMLDATVCDIYLVNEVGGLVGRPILTAAVDAYSGLCVGYCLSWEGGIYSLRNLMLNIVSDKKEHCREHGILNVNWSCTEMGGRLMTDMGKEYVSDTFSQLSELGINITNIQPYRPDLKSVVERFFKTIQDLYKPHLKGRGVIEPDFQTRGSHDYRLDACLTMEDFRQVILRTINFYNEEKTLENFQYTKEMLEDEMKPYSMDIWNWKKEHGEANLIEVSKEEIVLTLLPRTTGRFARNGLRVNKLRYHHPNYTQQYLTGEKDIVIAFNPDDVSNVWVREKNGKYVKFELIEGRYKKMTLEQVMSHKKVQSSHVGQFKEDKLQAEVELSKHIQSIVNRKKPGNNGIKGIRENRKKEEKKSHIDVMKEVYVC